MQTTFGAPFTAPSARTNPRTVDALVKVTASTVPPRSAARASAGSERGMRVLYASTRVGVHPFAGERVLETLGRDVGARTQDATRASSGTRERAHRS